MEVKGMKEVISKVKNRRLSYTRIICDEHTIVKPKRNKMKL